MTMTCSPKVLNEICETYPEITVAEFIAILQVRRLTEEQEEMTLEEAREFAQIEQDYQDLVYDMTHQ